MYNLLNVAASQLISYSPSVKWSFQNSLSGIGAVPLPLPQLLCMHQVTVMSYFDAALKAQSAYFAQKSRYGIYATLMRAKLKTGSEDLAALEATLFDTAGSTEDSLKKFQSSPSLNQEPATTAPKIKHNSRQAISNLHKS